MKYLSFKQKHKNNSIQFTYIFGKAKQPREVFTNSPKIRQNNIIGIRQKMTNTKENGKFEFLLFAFRVIEKHVFGHFPSLFLLEISSFWKKGFTEPFDNESSFLLSFCNNTNFVLGNVSELLGEIDENLWEKLLMTKTVANYHHRITKNKMI